MIKIEDTLKKAIEYSGKKSDYCDIRAFSSFTETLSRTEKEKTSSSSTVSGIGIRVLKDGAYGYSSCQKKDLGTIKSAIDAASRIASVAASKTINRTSQKEYRAIKATKKTRTKISPADISLQEKHSILNEARGYTNQKNIIFSQSRLSSIKTEKLFMNTEGSVISTILSKAILAHTCVAKRGDRQSMNYDVWAKPGGFEIIKELDLEKFIGNISLKASKFLDAGKPPSGKMDVIMSPQVAGTLVHEVFGHAAEADWIVNGRSLLKDKLNKRIGTDIMTICDDGSMDGGWGTVYYDDEGIPSKKTLLLDKGILVQFMHTRETAERLGMELTGNGRAQDHTHRIIPRMTNTYLAPGDTKVSEMIEDTKKGIIVDKYTIALEDPAGGSFELKTLGGHTIENGELKSPIERATLSSSSFIDTFMNVCAISGRMNKMNVGSCGKGHEDWISVGNPSPHIKIRNLIVGGI